MKATLPVFFILVLFCSLGSGCKKDSYHEKIKFANNSNQDVVLTRISPRLSTMNDSSFVSSISLARLEVIPANSSINYFEGKVNSIEDMYSGSRPILPFYIVDPLDMPQDTIPVDSFDIKVKYLKIIEPNLNELKASDFTYYYP